MYNVTIVNVDRATDFVGIKIINNMITVYVPHAFRKDLDPKVLNKELLLFLKSISIAKNVNKENISVSSNFKDGNIWSIESYLWIINDYIENDYYYPIEKMYSSTQKGKVDWKRTIRTTPLYSNGNLIYNQLVTTKSIASNGVITEIYKYCLAISLRRIGWVFNIKVKVKVDLMMNTKEMIYYLKRELSQTFDDNKRSRFKQMLNILSNINDSNIVSKKDTYGIEHYYYVFEKMVDMMFGNISLGEKKEYNPSSYWMIEGEGNEKQNAHLEPDTIHIHNISNQDKKIYIIDSKMYRYGTSKELRDLPGSQSIQKQITYGDYVKKKFGNSYVRNIFLLPYDKQDNKFNSKEDITYFGYAFADWRKEKQAHDYIFGYFIDLNYLLNNYKKSNVYINTMYDSVEVKLAKYNNQHGEF